MTNSKTGLYIGLAAIGTAILGTGAYFIFKPKATETGGEKGSTIPDSSGSDSGNTAPSGTGTNIFNWLLGNASTISDVAGGAINSGGLNAGEFIANVVYVCPKGSNGQITDASIMEIRFAIDNAKVKMGDTITLSGAGIYNGTYPIIGIWGTSNKVKTAMVRKMTGLTAAGVPTPNAKAYMASSSFDAII